MGPGWPLRGQRATLGGLVPWLPATLVVEWPNVDLVVVDVAGAEYDAGTWAGKVVGHVFFPVAATGYPFGWNALDRTVTQRGPWRKTPPARAGNQTLSSLSADFCCWSIPCSFPGPFWSQGVCGVECAAGVGDDGPVPLVGALEKRGDLGGGASGIANRAAGPPRGSGR